MNIELPCINTLSDEELQRLTIMTAVSGFMGTEFIEVEGAILYGMQHISTLNAHLVAKEISYESLKTDIAKVQNIFPMLCSRFVEHEGHVYLAIGGDPLEPQL